MLATSKTQGDLVRDHAARVVQLESEKLVLEARIAELEKMMDKTLRLITRREVTVADSRLCQKCTRREAGFRMPPLTYG
jgi:hypothetical protein